MRKTLASKNNLTFCSLLIFVATLSSGYVLAQSALETDALVAQCALYALITGQNYPAYAALAMATNQRTTGHLLGRGLARVQELKDTNQWEARKYAFLREHERSCKKLGVRVSDY